MNAKSWIFSIITGLILTAAALVSAFILMWGMENHKASVKPYAYLLFAVLSLVIIVAAVLFAGPISGWAARKFFPGSGEPEIVFNLIAAILAVGGGGLALLMATGATAAIFDDPLPGAASGMRVSFPEKTKVVFHKNPAWEEKLIVRFDETGWEKFRRSEAFQIEPLKIAAAENDENPSDWQTFEANKNRAQTYRWLNHGEPNRLRVLARRRADGQIYVYLYRQNGPAAKGED